MKRIVVTGSTDGLGRRIVERLAAPGTHLLVHGRDAERGRAVVEAIARKGGSAELLVADLGSLEEVRRLADAVLAGGKVDVLVNNAGIAHVKDARRESKDGHELHFAVNYLAPFLLTQRLRPALGRVVSVSSAGQTAIDLEDPMLTRSYGGFRAYAQSKLAQIMHTFDLAAEGVEATCLHPGTYIDTGMVRAAGITPATSIDAGADNVIALATGPDGARSGTYFDGRDVARANGQAYDLAARRRLRQLSDALTA